MALSSFNRSGLSIVTIPPNAVISGSPTGTYTVGGINYAFFQFSSSATVTVTSSGIVDLLLVGAGGSGYTNGVDTSGGGGAGYVLDTSVFLAAGTYAASPATAYGPGLTGRTTFGGTYGLCALGGNNAGVGGGSSGNGFSGGGGMISGGGGSTGAASGNTGGPGYTSSITGSAVVYAQGGNNAGARSGFGTGRDCVNAGGGLGVVIIRTRIT